jgi:hypothetical protein
VGDGETFFRAEIVAALNAAGLLTDDPDRPGGRRFAENCVDSPQLNCGRTNFHTIRHTAPTLLEQAILDASGKSVHVRLLPNGWLSSPPLLAVVDAEGTRYIFSPTPHVARPRASRWPSWFERRVQQTGVLRRFTDRLPPKPSSDATRDHSKQSGD